MGFKNLKIKPIYRKYLKKNYYELRKIFYRVKGYEQYNNATAEDRYPRIFTHLQSLVVDASDKKILSFGCSYGLECLSLRNYFPLSNIMGYDINSKNIKQAKSNNLDKNISFTDQFKDIDLQNNYNIIFAMSVLCRWPDTQSLTDCSSVYSFDNFDEKLKMLDSLLKIDGYLVVYNSNFRFIDATIASKYISIDTPNQTDSGFVNKFSSKNLLLEDQSYSHCVFKKIKL